MFIILEMHDEKILDDNNFNYLAVGNYHKKIRGYFPAFDTYIEAVENFPNSTIYEIVDVKTADHGVPFKEIENKI